MQYKIFEINKVKLSVHNWKTVLGCPSMFLTRHQENVCFIWWNFKFPSQQNQKTMKIYTWPDYTEEGLKAWWKLSSTR